MKPGKVAKPKPKKKQNSKVKVWDDFEGKKPSAKKVYEVEADTAKPVRPAPAPEKALSFSEEESGPPQERSTLRARASQMV